MKRPPEIDQERMSDADEHLPLRVCVFDLFHPDDLFLVEDLDRVESPVVLRPDEMDTAKRTGS